MEIDMDMEDGEEEKDVTSLPTHIPRGQPLISTPPMSQSPFMVFSLNSPQRSSRSLRSQYTSPLSSLPESDSDSEAEAETVLFDASPPPYDTDEAAKNAGFYSSMAVLRIAFSNSGNRVNLIAGRGRPHRTSRLLRWSHDLICILGGRKELGVHACVGSTPVVWGC